LERVLVSACLLGEKVRYDGGDKLCKIETLQRWRTEGRVVPLCPEVAGGFPTPRPLAEISNSLGGTAVLKGEAIVRQINGEDVTAGFLAGALAALAVVKKYNIRVAILKEGSPSCGTKFTYDGEFSGGTTNKPGVTAALLQAHGVFVFSEFELMAADLQLKHLAAANAA
jgi:uncharacterized protein YbbK (DUF523 family)